MSRNSKLGLTITGLIIAIAASHYIFGHTADDIYYQKNPWDVPKEETAAPGTARYENLPEPTGPEDALLKLEVYMKGGDDCHVPTIDMVNDVQTLYGSHLRIIYHDTRYEQIAARALEMKMGCEVAVYINGKKDFRVPGHGKYGFVTLDGPPGHTYVPADFKATVEMLLQEKGVDVEGLKHAASSATCTTGCTH